MPRIKRRITPAAQNAALKVLRAALTARIAETAQQAVKEYQESGADRWRTPFGTASVTTPNPAPAIGDEKAFMAWVRAHAPEEIVEQIRPGFTESLLKNYDIVDDTVYDRRTGEPAPDWLTIQPAGDPYLSVRGNDDAKHASEDVSARLDELAMQLLSLIHGDEETIQKKEQ